VEKEMEKEKEIEREREAKGGREERTTNEWNLRKWMKQGLSSKTKKQKKPEWNIVHEWNSSINLPHVCLCNGWNLLTSNATLLPF
jgi:hypothetical protein